MITRILMTSAMLAGYAQAPASELFVSIDGMVIVADADSTGAESLAVSRFNRRISAFTGKTFPVCWGTAPVGVPLLRVGTAMAAAALSSERDWDRAPGADDADVRRQSYVIDCDPGDAGAPPVVYVFGFGESADARSSLGLGYALGELLRRLDVRDGVWGFALPGSPLVSSPKTPNRTLYLMNSVGWASRGLSLDYDDPQALEGYVDALIEAGYSRISLWQWYMIYLYPGNYEDRRADNERIHRGMRHLLDYSRRRGLEIYHMLTPIHANPDLLPDDPKFAATGYYGRTSVCWAQPEARELARAMARTEMEYYGPVDGYIVWFYDPGGCFCPDCWERQGDHLFEQLMLVVELARTISPDAEFEACLWPTWCFHEAQWGINYPREEVKVFVRGFLDRALAYFGPRNLTIMDSCDTSFSEYEYVIYDGTVDADQFKRNGFMHRVLGTPGEASYPFSPFMFRYISEVVGQARDWDLDESLFSAIYVGSTFPSVYAFADTLWHAGATADETMRRYASTVAKGEAGPGFARVLSALEDMATADTYEEKDASLSVAEAAWADVRASALFQGDRDAMGGYVEAQRRYLEMARASDEAGFIREYDLLRERLSAVPMYSDYMGNVLTPEVCAKLHVLGYWRGPVGDASMVGVPGEEPAAAWIGVHKTGD